MKIIVIGAGGFIGSYLTNELTTAHQVLPIYKDSIDLFDNETVKILLEKIEPDVIINCLTFGINDKQNDATNVSKNLSMFYNFYSNSNLFKYFINIGSGIEKTDSTSAYAFSKKAIFNLISDNKKFITLRLFGCFGKNENESRLLKKFLSSKEPFKIVDDRKFDFISIQDFYNILKFVLDNLEKSVLEKYNNIDCVYGEKITISEFLQLFCDINNIEKNYIIESTSENNYVGDYDTIRIFNSYHGLRLYGLAHGLKVYV